MKQILPQYYQFSDKEFEQLFKECIFVFDTNVLLNIYRYPVSAKEDFLKILKRLSKEERVWLPFQVCLEFQENRLTVIAEQKRKFSEVKKIISDIKKDLTNKLHRLELRKRHSLINPDELTEKIEDAFNEYENHLGEIEKEQVDIYQKDFIRDEIDTIFKDKTGESFSQEELNEIYKEGALRYKQQRPPGFEDEKEKKDKFYFHNDLTVRREFGDLIYWKEVIRYVDKNNIKKLVLVTDDDKDDWWQKIGSKKIGPRKELISEITSQTELEMFHMYNSEKFMEFAKKFLRVRIDKDTIEQIKQAFDRTWVSKYRRLLSEMYNSECQICGTSNALNICHVKPVSKGGEASDLSNLLLLCADHNAMLDLGGLYITEDFTLKDKDDEIHGKLRVHPLHDINYDNLTWYNKSNLKD